MLSARPLVLVLGLLLGALESPTAARAASFDPTTGKVVTSDSRFAEGFEAASPSLTLFDDQNMLLATAALVAAFNEDESTALEGRGTLRLGGTIIAGVMDLRALAPTFSGHRVEVKFWQRPEGTHLIATLVWVSGEADDLLVRDDLQSTFIAAEMPFEPTGRATDDGWEEWSSGPVDFTEGAMLPPTAFAFYDSALQDLTGFLNMSYSTFDTTARVRIDALTIDDLGPAHVPASACTLLNESTSCGPDGACLWGRCVDSALALGAKIEDPTLRNQYLARKIFEYRTFEGGRSPQTRVDGLANALSGLGGTVSNGQFWTTMRNAIQDLADGHASAPIAAAVSSPQVGVCLHTGLADLIPSSPRRPLVFSTRSTNPVGSMLQRGDALVAIDGTDVASWTQAARRYLEYHGDPAGREVVIAPQIMDAALYTGATLALARCPQSSTSSTAAAVPCDMAHVVTVTVDLAAVESGIWSGSPPVWRNDADTCDYRFHRPFDTADGKAYTFAGFVDQGGVRWIQFNGVPSQHWQGGPQWFQTMSSALRGDATKIILDERTGGGGDLDAVDLITKALITPADYYGNEMIPALGQPTTDALRGALRTCTNGQTSGSGCGGFIEWLLGESQPMQAPGAESTSKVAALLSMDVSGNDYLSKMLTYRHTGATRLFGPSPTFGAFGMVWFLPAMGGDFAGGSLQSQDSIFRANVSDPNALFSTSTGVPPDEVVLEKQSDAVRDVDTLVEAAKEWLAR
jgi:hypothetical protein